MADPPPTYGVAQRNSSSVSEVETAEGSGELQSAYATEEEVPVQTESEERIVSTLSWSAKNMPRKATFHMKRALAAVWNLSSKITQNAHQLRTLHAAGISVPELLRRGYSLLRIKRDLGLTTVGALCKNGLSVKHMRGNTLMWTVLLQHFSLSRHHLEKYFGLIDFSDYLSVDLSAKQLESLAININGLLADGHVTKEDLRKASFEKHWDWKEWQVFGFDEDAARTLEMQESDYLAFMRIHPQQMAKFLGILNEDKRSIETQHDLDIYNSVHMSQ
jgi:hypothetical protein